MRYIYLIPLALLASGAPALQAQSGVGEPLRFTRLERDYNEGTTLLQARATLANAIPKGSAFATALDTLKQAGARCEGDTRDATLARCTYAERITINDYYPGDAIWEVSLHLRDGMADGVTVDRRVRED